MHIGIIGMGIVGRAVADCALIKGCSLSTFDKYRTERTQNWEAINKTLMCFVCVPTPTIPITGCDTREVEAALNLLAALKYKEPVVVKSTVIPGTMRRLTQDFPSLRLVHNPEFLTEKNAKKDFQFQSHVLLSGITFDAALVDFFYDKVIGCPRTSIVNQYEITEWAKYIHNCILATKLSFLNEIYQLIKDPKTFNESMRLAQEFGNIGDNSKVPGPDGKLGWGGMCFPKDMKALSIFAARSSILTPTIDGAIETNRKLRPEAMRGGKDE